MTNNPTDLHEHMLHEVKVRDDIVLRPMEEIDGHELLAIMARDPEIRERVTVAANMLDHKGVKNRLRLTKTIRH